MWCGAEEIRTVVFSVAHSSARRGSNPFAIMVKRVWGQLLVLGLGALPFLVLGVVTSAAAVVALRGALNAALNKLGNKRLATFCVDASARQKLL